MMKEKFLEIYRQNISRPGADKLLAWLETTDFFEAPASTRFHLSRPGGLVEHSIHVYERLKALVGDGDYLDEYLFGSKAAPGESIAICGLLHDICKANFYTVEMRNRKNEQGQWEKYPYYVVDDQLPYGHGEKSVYIISGFMKLTRPEAMAIRWHMGFSGGEDSRLVGQALQQYPLAFALSVADMEATYFLEREDGEPSAGRH